MAILGEERDSIAREKFGAENKKRQRKWRTIQRGGKSEEGRCSKRYREREAERVGEDKESQR